MDIYILPIYKLGVTLPAQIVGHQVVPTFDGHQTEPELLESQRPSHDTLVDQLLGV